jgi:hypothetical protein
MCVSFALALEATPGSGTTILLDEVAEVVKQNTLSSENAVDRSNGHANSTNVRLLFYHALICQRIRGGLPVRGSSIVLTATKAVFY